MNEALKYYRLAAEQGHASAQKCLGVCYKNGNGKNPLFIYDNLLKTHYFLT